MADEGMVSRRKDGLYAYYRIEDPSLSGLCLLVCGQLEQQIAETSEAAGRPALPTSAS